MVDTAFQVAPQNIARFAANYSPAEGGGLTLIDDPLASPYAEPQTLLSGGGGLPITGGLTGTAGDYWRLAQALANGGELDGARIIGRKTLELMTSNHLSAGGDIASVGYGPFTGSAYNGVGFGLGSSVLIDPVRSGVPGSRGEIGWAGSATTTFFVDPAEELVFVFMTQLTPLWTYDVRREFRAIVYGALT